MKGKYGNCTVHLFFRAFPCLDPRIQWEQSEAPGKSKEGFLDPSLPHFPSQGRYNLHKNPSQTQIHLPGKAHFAQNPFPNPNPSPWGQAGTFGSHTPRVEKLECTEKKHSGSQERDQILDLIPYKCWNNSCVVGKREWALEMVPRSPGKVPKSPGKVPKSLLNIPNH